MMLLKHHAWAGECYAEGDLRNWQVSKVITGITKAGVSTPAFFIAKKSAKKSCQKDKITVNEN